MEKAGHIFGTLFAIPSILGALAMLGFHMAAKDIPATDDPEAVGQFLFFFRWMLIFGTLGQITPLLSLLSIWMANWTSGLTPIFSWAILLVAGISSFLVGGFGLIVGPIVIIFCLSSENLAFWK